MIGIRENRINRDKGSILVITSEILLDSVYIALDIMKFC